MPKKKKKKSWKKKALRILLIGLLLAVVSFGGFLASIYFGFWGKLPTTQELSNLKQLQASRVYDDSDVLIGKYFITDREAITFEDVPPYLIHALIATEDARFYEHKGIDRQSMMRVLFKSILMRDRSSGGGSTLTLQLAKNLYGRKSYPVFTIAVNKIKEAFVAKRIEKIYSKDEILSLYLNTVPFPGDTYGIESAAQKFFHSSTKALSLSQAATLVGSLKANHSYNPRLFPERSQLRRDVVIQQMKKYGYLTEEEAHQVMQEELKIDYRNYGSSTAPAPYFMEQVKKEVEKLLKDEKYHKEDGTPYQLREDGLRIYTTLDSRLQNYAETAVREHLQKLQRDLENAYGKNPPWKPGSALVEKAITGLPEYKKLKKQGKSHDEIKNILSQPKETELFDWEKNQVQNVSAIDSLRHYMKFLNTGLVSVDPHSGAIKAYVGGIDYRYFQYDHVRQGKRQVGSTFKPFVYTAAFENGFLPCDYFSVKEMTYTDLNDWTPKNSNRNIDPELNFSLAEALTQSLNTVTIKVLRMVQLENLMTQVRKFGIEEEMDVQPSMGLGTPEIGMIEMAKAYTAFLNENQRPMQPFFLKRIEDKHGNLIAEFEQPRVYEKAMSKNTQETMVAILKDVVDRGTSRRLRSIYGFQNDLAGKTGTTQGNKDGWFVGMLPDLVTVTWVGNDNSQITFPNTTLGQGANSALPVFAKMLQKMNADRKYDPVTRARFKPPSAEVLAALDCEPSVKDDFLKKLFKKNEEEKSFETNNREIKKQKRQQQRKQKKKKKKKGFLKRIFGGK